MRELFHSFTIRDYRWLWLVTTFINAGKWTFTLIVTWQAYELTHSSSWSGAMMFATLVPNIIGAPIAGVLADILDRRRIMLFATIVQIVVTGLLGILSYAHWTTAGWLLVLAFIFGFATSGLSVMVSSLVPVIIPSEKLFNALSLQAVAQRGTEFVGPAIASPLLILYGPGTVYFFALCLYVISAASVFMIAKVEIHSENRQDGSGRRIFAPLVDGFAYIRKTPTIGLLVSLVGLHCALTMAYMGMLPQFVKNLHGTGAFYGAMVSTIGLGSIIGTLVLAGTKHVRMRGSMYWITAVLSGLSLSWLAITKNHDMAIFVIAFVGASQAVFMTLSLGYIQQMAAAHMRGRVTSFYLVLAGGFMSLANLGYGALSNAVAPHLIMAITGLLFTIIVVVYAAFSRQFRSVSKYGAFEPKLEETAPSLPL